MRLTEASLRHYSSINHKKSNYRKIAFCNFKQEKLLEIKPKDPKVGWVVSGGGARCAFQAGALQALVDAQILPDFIQTLSFGSVNSAIMLGHKDGLKALTDYWLNMSKDKLYSIKLRINSVFDNSPLRNFLTRNVDSGKVLENNTFGNPEFIIHTAQITPSGAVKAVFATDKAYDKLKEKDKRLGNPDKLYKLTKENLHKAIMASTTIPIAVPPEKIDDKLFIDCGAISHPYIEDGLITLTALKDNDQKGVLIVILTRPREEYNEKINFKKLGKLGLNFANITPVIISPRFEDTSMYDFNKAGKEASKSIQFGYMETIDALYKAKLIDREKYISLNRNLNLVA